MELSQYLDKMMIKHANFARKAGITQAHLSRIMKGDHNISLRIAMSIEKASEGKVKCKDIYESWLKAQAASKTHKDTKRKK